MSDLREAHEKGYHPDGSALQLNLQLPGES